jgi:hypothetical protein
MVLFACQSRVKATRGAVSACQHILTKTYLNNTIAPRWFPLSGTLQLNQQAQTAHSGHESKVPSLRCSFARAAIHTYRSMLAA